MKGNRIAKNAAGLPKGGAHIKRGTDGWSVYFWNTADQFIQFPSPDKGGQIVVVKAGENFYDVIKNKVDWGNISFSQAYQTAQTIGKPASSSSRSSGSSRSSSSRSSGSSRSSSSKGTTVTPGGTPVVPGVATIPTAGMAFGTTGKIVAGGLAVVIGGLLIRRMIAPPAPRSIIAPPPSPSTAQKFIDSREQDELEKMRANIFAN